MDPYVYGGGAMLDAATSLKMGGSAIGAILLMKAVDYFMNRRANRAQENQLIAAADGSAGLIEKLNTRIIALESRQTDLESRLNEEVEKRLKAQEEVSRLRQRIAVFTAVMRHHKIDVPAEDMT